MKWGDEHDIQSLTQCDRLGTMQMICQPRIIRCAHVLQEHFKVNTMRNTATLGSKMVYIICGRISRSTWTMPNPYAIVELTDNVAQYMAAKYLQSKQPSVVIPIPPGWTTWMVSECDHAISVILVAVKNRRKNCTPMISQLIFTVF